MKKRDRIIKETMTIFLTILSTNVIATEKAAPPTMEKCYGIVKAGMNDCATATQSCAGSATKDKQPDAFLFVAKGACQKIVGGVLNSNEQPKDATTK